MEEPTIWSVFKEFFAKKQKNYLESRRAMDKNRTPKTDTLSINVFSLVIGFCFGLPIFMIGLLLLRFGLLEGLETIFLGSWFISFGWTLFRRSIPPEEKMVFDYLMKDYTLFWIFWTPLKVLGIPNRPSWIIAIALLVVWNLITRRRKPPFKG